MESKTPQCQRCLGSKHIVVISGEEHPMDPGVDRVSYERMGGRFYECSDCASPPPQIPMAGGIAASSPCPPFHLIPTIGLIGLAERFQKGIERKGDKSWNAVSSNQACLKDKAFAIERLSHVIDHATKLRDKLQADDISAMQDDDDAGAIAWAGIFLYCVVDGLKKKALQNDFDSI